MRELHDGIELLEEERTGGPFVWKNWDKWLPRCEEVLTFVDSKVRSDSVESPTTLALKQRGMVCGVEWPIFRRVVERYRKWLNDCYGGVQQLREHLVFAHNDVCITTMPEILLTCWQTQYGNILRLDPPGQSPLLLPANEHKQLVVIDFEYANANMVGFEFANHFVSLTSLQLPLNMTLIPPLQSEWCYNYHDPKTAFSCNTAHYPTPDEQRRFIRAYVQHRPQFSSAVSATPRIAPATPGGLPRIDSFVLDGRGPSSLEQPSSIPDPAELAINNEIEHLLEETRLWRIACSAHWVAWGVVQAHVPGMASEESTQAHLASNQGSDLLNADGRAGVEDLAAKRPDSEEEGEAAEDEEFDYLSYARERAMLFWGDVVQLGLVEPGELPDEIAKAVKIIHY